MVRTALVGRRQGGNRMIRIQLVCDACGRQSDHHTSLGLNLRDDTEAAGWVWVITDRRMEHVCPRCAA